MWRSRQEIVNKALLRYHGAGLGRLSEAWERQEHQKAGDKPSGQDLVHVSLILETP